MIKFLKRISICSVISLFLVITMNGAVFAEKGTLKGTLIGYLLNITTEVVSGSSVQVAPASLKGIYLTASTAASSNLDEIIRKLINSGGNMVVIDVEHGGGRLAFTPKNEYLKKINPGSKMLDNLPVLIEKLKAKGIYVIARQVIFNDPYTSSRKPDWRIKNKWGGTFDYRWLDPSKPGVQMYNLLIMEEVAQLGFNEIQFDYIRFPATNHNNLNYHYDEENFTTSVVIFSK